MKATGIVRRIDDLGRVVIPKEIRRTMRIREGDPSRDTRNIVNRQNPAEILETPSCTAFPECVILKKEAGKGGFSMEVTIKKGDPSRLEDYVDVMRDSALWEHYYAPDETVLRDGLADALARGAVFIAETSSGEAVGLMVCEWEGMFGAWPYPALLGVKKNCRGMGVGHRLLDVFEGTGKALGARNLFICVSTFNPRARALYVSRGFRKAALIPGLYRDGVAENVLIKRIGG